MTKTTIEITPSLDQIRHEFALAYATAVLEKQTSYGEVGFYKHYSAAQKVFDKLHTEDVDVSKE